MLDYRKWLLLLAFVIGFIVGYGTKKYYYSSKFLVGKWEQDPIVVICPSSRVNVYRVMDAIDWWKDKGYNINNYHYDIDNTICSKGRFIQGVIFIRDKKEIGENILAETSRFMMIFEIVSAEINFPDSNRYLPRLLEHELGHALGFGHVEEQGHIMHPILEMTGENFWIPE
jgi:hypothetical protein